MDIPPRQSGFRFSWKWVIPVGCVAILACVGCVAAVVLFLVPSGVTSDIQRQIEVSNSTPATPQYKVGDMQALIQKQGGKPCADNEELTCITIQVPLDHFDTSNTKTLDVVFGIHPATGTRKGMFVQAFPGGPGGKGIASSTLDLYDDKVKESFDIVFFDQRGLGLSGPIDCPKALETYFETSFSDSDTDGVEGLDTPKEQTKATDQAKTFVDGCMAEIGLPTDQLKLYATPQVAEDLETFRQRVGDDKFYLYGVSYGTAVAETYASAHADHLAGLVLDGTIDLTLDAPTTAHNQEKAFEKALLATFDECRKETDCMGDFGGADPQKVYDDLAASLSKKPAEFAFPLADGTSAKHIFTFNKLEGATSFMMYSLYGRMIYLRALAAAHQGNFVPLARLLYASQNYDPASERYVGDPTFSYSAYFIVNCTDDTYFNGTPEEKLAQIFKDGQASNGTVPRLDGNIYSGLPCAFWPSQPQTEQPAAPLAAKGVPTFVLDATLDPATPFDGGKAVYQRLDQGYFLYVNGGQHSIYGRQEHCPDDTVTDFLVYDKLPAQKETECKWDSPVMWNYLKPVPADAKQFGDLKQAMFQTDIDILLLPEHLLNSRKGEEISTACPAGGKLSFTLGKDEKETFTFTDCAFSKGFVMNGTGSADLKSGHRTYEWQVSGYKSGNLTYTYDSTLGISLKGTYGGANINQ